MVNARGGRSGNAAGLLPSSFSFTCSLPEKPHFSTHIFRFLRCVTAQIKQHSIKLARSICVYACSVFARRVLVTDPNNGVSSASSAQVLPSPITVESWLYHVTLSLVYISARTTQAHPVFNNISIVAFIFFAKRTCIPSCCLETALVYLLISRLFQNNGYARSLERGIHLWPGTALG
jgi:hypothetical protein